MQFTSCVFLAMCGFMAIPSKVHAVISLEPLSSIYIPYAYQGLTGLYDIDAAAVEQSAYDKDAKILYAAGDHYIHIVDLADPNLPTIINKFILSTRANDIEICGDYIGLVVEGTTSQDDGYVIVRGKYDRATESWQEFNPIKVGSKPDMLKFSHECSLIVTANEGEADQSPDKSSFINPEGSVSIVRNFASSEPSVSTMDFTSFNCQRNYYEWFGVRAPYTGQISGGENGTFSQNMEPEYIAISEDDQTAYICLQENNAIAVVDIPSNTITQLLPLGTKDWNNLNIDASDKDGKIASKEFDIYSFYQPDAIKLYRFNGEDYLITANEGDRFEYVMGNDDWDEVKRGEDLHDDNDLSSYISSSLEDDMNDDDKLGRLKFSKHDGLDSDGKVLEPHFFGARGVSIFKPCFETMELVWDSGDEVERVIAEYYPDVFNGDTKPDDKDKESPEDLKDTRSDNLGPECESIEVGTMNGKDYVFIGVDRTAAILIYQINLSMGYPTLQFESVYRAGGTGDSFQTLLDERDLGDLDPEDITFVSASDSDTNEPLLIVTSTVSGTVSVYKVIDN